MGNKIENGITRREALGATAAIAAGAAIATVGGSAQAAEDSSRAVLKEVDGKMTSTISLDWKEVYYTNCPLISASNVDQELGWTNEEFAKIGVEFAYFRSRPETDWYPHYIHNQENLIRFGGLFPPIHVNADYRRTRMLGLTHVPYEGGCMMVRAGGQYLRDERFERQEDRYHQEPEHAQERLVAHSGTPGHPGHAADERYDGKGCETGRLPVPGRLVRRSRHADAYGQSDLVAVEA